MWWMIFLLVLAGCGGELVDLPVLDNITEIENVTEQNITIANNTMNNSANAINETNVTIIDNIIPSSNKTNSSNSSQEVLTGSFVRFYMNTIDGLQNVALSEGSKKNISGKMVEVVLVSSSGGVPKTLLRVDDELSQPLEEKESDFVGGNYVFVMEILYR